MKKMTVEEALKFAEENFPYAPEKLAEFLEIEVRRSPLNCDGWCLRGRPIIRINSRAPEVRQRFTLAHELGHLILDIPATVGESVVEYQNAKSAEEKKVNELAGQLLLPTNVVKRFLSEIPVTSAVIKKIANKANVSETSVIRRLAVIAKHIGLKDGAIVCFQQNVYAWHWPAKWVITEERAEKLLIACLEAKKQVLRLKDMKGGDVLVASTVHNPSLNNTTIFLQVVDKENGRKKLNEEFIRDLEETIFENAREFQPKLQGCFGIIKSIVKDKSIEDAIAYFNERYLEKPNLERWSEEFRMRLRSPQGQKYIEHRLIPWVKKCKN